VDALHRVVDLVVQVLGLKTQTENVKSTLIVHRTGEKKFKTLHSAHKPGSLAETRLTEGSCPFALSSCRQPRRQCRSTQSSSAPGRPR
jgi:hypothetical protein